MVIRVCRADRSHGPDQPPSGRSNPGDSEPVLRPRGACGAGRHRSHCGARTAHGGGRGSSRRGWAGRVSGAPARRVGGLSDSAGPASGSRGRPAAAVVVSARGGAGRGAAEARRAEGGGGGGGGAVLVSKSFRYLAYPGWDGVGYQVPSLDIKYLEV